MSHKEMMVTASTDVWREIVNALAFYIVNHNPSDQDERKNWSATIANGITETERIIDVRLDRREVS